MTWIVEQHGLFQSYYYAHHLGGNRDGREKFRDHRWYQACKDFCANWDQCSFDPDYPVGAARNLRAAGAADIHPPGI